MYTLYVGIVGLMLSSIPYKRRFVSTITTAISS